MDMATSVYAKRALFLFLLTVDLPTGTANHILPQQTRAVDSGNTLSPSHVGLISNNETETSVDQETRLEPGLTFDIERQADSEQDTKPVAGAKVRLETEKEHQIKAETKSKTVPEIEHNTEREPVNKTEPESKHELSKSEAARPEPWKLLETAPQTPDCPATTFTETPD